MIYLEILALALGLAMDAFSVTLSMGAVYKKIHIKHTLLIAGMFGLFQAIMPLIGWMIGYSLSSFLEPVAHLIAFYLLVIIGLKMIYESGQLEKTGKSESFKINIATILILSVATSIDALAAGFTITLLETSLCNSIIAIGLITFALCVIGTQIGSKFGHLFEGRIEIIGGIILILIGIKTLLY